MPQSHVELGRRIQSGDALCRQRSVDRPFTLPIALGSTHSTPPAVRTHRSLGSQFVVNTAPEPSGCNSGQVTVEDHEDVPTITASIPA